MRFVKIIERFNLFQLQEATRLQDITINPGVTIVALNDDNSVYGVCSAIANTKLLTAPSIDS